MKKTVLLLLSLILVNSVVMGAENTTKKVSGPFGYNLYDDINRAPKTQKASDATASSSSKSKASTSSAKSTASAEMKFYGDETEAEWEKENINYYPNATLKDAVGKYQAGNYSGCLQEMISLTKIDPMNPIVYYYLGMAYTQVGNKDQAVKAYEYVIKLNSEKTITQYALKGRDCLVGGPTCSAGESEASEEDKQIEDFVNAPYGNGFSDQINEEIRQKELNEIQETINQKPNLEVEDIERIKNFDNKSAVPEETKVAEVTNEDILAAIETLKKAGVTVSVNPYQTMPMDNEYSQLSMLLGNNNNNNNNSMMNMLPYLMGQANNGQKIDPQLIQSMMMSSMLTDITFTDNDKK